MGWLTRRRARRQHEDREVALRRVPRRVHNDRDVACVLWWGDRGGSAVGVQYERCGVCNPREV